MQPTRRCTPRRSSCGFNPTDNAIESIAGGITFLINTYDAKGTVSLQTQADSTTDEFAYTLDVNTRVTQTDVTDPHGHVRRVTFTAY